MSNKFKDTDTHAHAHVHTHTHTHYFYNGTIDIKNFDLNKFKKDSKYWKINSVNSLHLVKNEFNGYFLFISENKYLTLVPINESKGIIKKYEEFWSKIKI